MFDLGASVGIQAKGAISAMGADSSIGFGGELQRTEQSLEGTMRLTFSVGIGAPAATIEQFAAFDAGQALVACHQSKGIEGASEVTEEARSAIPVAAEHPTPGAADPARATNANGVALDEGGGMGEAGGSITASATAKSVLVHMP